jgi:hypothetical protein
MQGGDQKLIQDFGHIGVRVQQWEEWKETILGARYIVGMLLKWILQG